MKYSNLSSAIRPVDHNDDIPMPVCNKFNISSDEPSEQELYDEKLTDMDEDNIFDNDFEGPSEQSVLFDQESLCSDLIRDLNSSKQSSEILHHNWKSETF